MSSIWKTVQKLWQAKPFSVSMQIIAKQTSTCRAEQSDDESDDSLYLLEEVGMVNHQQTRQFFTALQVLE